MESPECQADFEVELLPLSTPEERRAAAEEWAAYHQAVGQVRARELGAVAVLSSRDESAEALLSLLEDGDSENRNGFVASALLRVIKKNDEAEVIDLLRGYYDSGV